MKDIEAKNIVEEHQLLQTRVESLESELLDHKTRNDDLTAENTAFEARVAELERINQDQESALEKIEAENAELQDQVDSLTQEEISGTEKAVTILESVAVEPVEQGEVSEEPSNAYAEYMTITDPAEKVSFYRNNKEKILGGLK